MIRTIASIAALGLLISCGDGNPFFPLPEDDSDPSVSNIYATEANDEATLNNLVYLDQGTADPADDVLRVNNLPFDGTDANSGGYTPMAGADLQNNFTVFESPVLSERRYFAVFRRTTSSQVLAAGTGDYVNFGYGGAAAHRLNATTDMPASGEYVYTGEYAAVRITTLDGGRDDVEYITGAARLSVDIADFDITGAVEGVINNRRLFDSFGTYIGDLDDFVSLATAEIDFENQLTLMSTANGYDFDSEDLTAGQWQAIFTGPDAEEIAGFVFLEGTVATGSDDDEVRETGVFIVVRP